MARRSREDKAPEGGWLGPPGNTQGLVPLAIAVGSRNGKWKWKEPKLTPKQKRDHAEFQRKMAKADAKGKWRFKWKPE